MLDIDMGWSIIGDCIREKMVELELIEEETDLADNDVDELIYGYLNEKCEPLTKEVILSMEDWAREVVLESGADEDHFDEWMEEN